MNLEENTKFDHRKIKETNMLMLTSHCQKIKRAVNCRTKQKGTYVFKVKKKFMQARKIHS